MAGSPRTPVGGKSTNRRDLQQLLIDLDEMVADLDEMASIIPSSPQQATTASSKLTRVLSLRPAIRNFLKRGKGTEQGAGSKSNEAVVPSRQVTELKPTIVPEIRPTPPEEHPHSLPGLEAHISISRPGSPQATVPSSPESEVSSSSESGERPLLPPDYDAEFVEKAYFMFGVTTLAKKQHFDDLYLQARGLPVPYRGLPKRTECNPYRPSQNTNEVCRHCFPQQQPSHTAALSQGRQSGSGPDPPVISGPSTLYNPLRGSDRIYKPFYQGPLPQFRASKADNAPHVAEKFQHNVYAASFSSPQRPFPPYSAGIPLPPGYAPRPPYESTTRHFQSFPYAGPQQQQPLYQPQQQTRMPPPPPPPPSTRPQSSRWAPQHHISTRGVSLDVGTGP